VKSKRAVEFHDPLKPSGLQDDFEFVERERRRFETDEQYKRYLESLPQVEHLPDLKAKPVKFSLRLSQHVTEGFRRLAEAHGLSDGQTLMRMVLQNYLNAHFEEALPEEEETSNARP
jgi:predicted DNA binding CopG/RHH family protein